MVRHTSRASAGPVAHLGLEEPRAAVAPVQRAEPLGPEERPAWAGQQEQVAQQVAAERPGLPRGTIRRVTHRAQRRVQTSIRSAAISAGLPSRLRMRGSRACHTRIRAARPNSAQRAMTPRNVCPFRATSTDGAPVMRIVRLSIATLLTVTRRRRSAGRAPTRPRNKASLIGPA